MGLAYGIIGCLAYILGLLSTGVAWGGWVVLGLGVSCALVIPRYWRTAPRSRVWLIAGVIGLGASLYFQSRVPQPASNDISNLIPGRGSGQELVVNVQGRVESLPRLTRSQKAQFWLRVQTVIRQGKAAGDGDKPLAGKLYVTVSSLQATGIHPGQRISVEGSLYKPQPATNPGGFDFARYLAQEGCFAGLRGRQIEPLEKSAGWGWWMIQQRIVRSHMRWLGSPEAPLVSSMVLGSRGVDLPYDLKDKFTQVGLAHALAASGFHTSLILGVVLTLTRRFSERTRFVLGTLALIIFVGLTGLQPSVLRAALMGFGGLVALLLRRKIKPLGALLVVATLLLIYNPLWIWNLGFQFSFLATVGLIVTVPPLTKWLDWMPSAIAPLVAVPIAAYLWTLPLQLYTFGVLSPYSILVNLVATPLISLLSLGGMVSALAAMIWSPAGSALAWLLKYPAQGLIAIVDGFSQLPGNAYAVGTISALTAIALYALIGLTWLQPWWRQRCWLALLLGLGLIVIPAWQARASLFRVTVLATTGQPVMVIQQGWHTALVGGGKESTIRVSTLPFLQKEGVNQVQAAVFTQTQPLLPAGKIGNRIPVKQLYTPSVRSKNSMHSTSPVRLEQESIPTHQFAQIGGVQFRQLNREPTVLEMQIGNQTWLWFDGASPEQQEALLATGTLPKVQVLRWDGRVLNPKLIAALQPKVAIATGRSVAPDTAGQLQQRAIQLFWTGRDGAIQWTPTDGFKTMLAAKDNRPSPL